MSDQEKLLKEKLLSEKDPLTRAAILKNLHFNLDVKTKDLAKLLKVSEPYISSMMRLLKLPELVIDGYYSDMVKLTHLLVLSRLDDPEIAKKAYEEVLIKNLSTQATDDLVRSYKYSMKSNIADKVTPLTMQKIREAMKKIDPLASIKLVQTRIRTKIVIERQGDMATTTGLIKKIAKILEMSKPDKV